MRAVSGRRAARGMATGVAVLASLVVPVTVPQGSVVLRTSPVALAATPTPSPSPSAGGGVAGRSTTAPLRVASYNIRNANSYEGKKNEKRWEDRRGAVVAAVQRQDLDVLAVQEATQGLLHDAESEPRRVSQFDDLVQRLGGAWRLTNATRYNCAKDTSPKRCSYVEKGASEGNRILYDASRVELLDEGSRLLPVPAGKGDNYMAWAELRQLSTGKRFLVSNLHTVGKDRDHAIKKEQASVALAELRAHNRDELPMIALGDWNSSRFEKPSNGPYDVYVRAGFVDPLGQRYRSTTKAPHATVEHRVRTWLNSSNPTWARKAPGHRTWVNGSYIDYILTTPMRVSEWETVARLSKKKKFKGVIPSDHNMVRATVWLP